MRVDVAGEPGDPGRANEDFAGVATTASGRGGVVVVLDGVTPPPDGDDGCVHGVPWFTARLGGTLLELASREGGSALAECLARAVTRTADAHRATCDLTHRRTPQATVVAARWDTGTLEYLVLSDSALLLEGADGRVDAVLDTRLDTLPPHVGALRREVRALPAGSPERSRAAAAYVGAVEALRNPAGGEAGFFTAAADPAVAARAVTGEVPVEGVRTLLALTDGVTRWSLVFRRGDWTDLLRAARDRGCAALVGEVRALEAADPHGAAHPRGKTHDDATAVLVEPA